MAAPVISVEKLSKCYLLGHRDEGGGSHTYTAFRDIIGREIRNAVRKAADVVRGRPVVRGDTVEEFWALRDVSFEVAEGEVLGIIGRNGAGKSTLLKILSRITEPTAGRVTLRGRVASLLEVGTGFHPELTGRENIYLNGAILGMSRAEIRKKFDEIVAFAEVEKFLDTPVKRYSSGMYVRLAFAVAAHLEPEILIVDEVLAVGDSEFQNKCLGKMDEVSRHGGRTVLFVSHNMAAIEKLCSTAILLEGGYLRGWGRAPVVTDTFIHQRKSPRKYDDFRKNRPSWAKEWIKSVRFLNEEGLECDDFGLGESIIVELDFRGEGILRRPEMGIVIHHRSRGEIINANTRMTGYKFPEGQYYSGKYHCTLSSPPLARGDYLVDVWLSDSANDIDMVKDAGEFRVHERDIYQTGVLPFTTSLIVFKPSWNFTPAGLTTVDRL
jgi:lipopolysaccharide transport system ATP-binding protein